MEVPGAVPCRGGGTPVPAMTKAPGELALGIPGILCLLITTAAQLTEQAAPEFVFRNSSQAVGLGLGLSVP